MIPTTEWCPGDRPFIKSLEWPFHSLCRLLCDLDTLSLALGETVSSAKLKDFDILSTALSDLLFFSDLDLESLSLLLKSLGVALNERDTFSDLLRDLCTFGLSEANKSLICDAETFAMSLKPAELAELEAPAPQLGVSGGINLRKSSGKFPSIGGFQFLYTLLHLVFCSLWLVLLILPLKELFFTLFSLGLKPSPLLAGSDGDFGLSAAGNVPMSKSNKFLDGDMPAPEIFCCIGVVQMLWAWAWSWFVLMASEYEGGESSDTVVVVSCSSYLGQKDWTWKCNK